MKIKAKKYAILFAAMLASLILQNCGTLQIMSATEGNEAGTIYMTANPLKQQSKTGGDQNASKAGQVIKCVAAGEQQLDCSQISVSEK